MRFPREQCDAAVRVRALLLRFRCHMQLRNNDDARRDADEAAAWGGGARADVARALAYERLAMLRTGTHCAAFMWLTRRRRCDRQQLALSIVSAALAATSSAALPIECRQEALDCMRRSVQHIPPPTQLPCTSPGTSLSNHLQSYSDKLSCSYRLKAAVASSSCRSCCADNDALRSLPALHAGALAHANQVAHVHRLRI